MHLNHVQLPKYDALKDKNLSSFFEKPSLKRRLVSIQNDKKNTKEKEKTIPRFGSSKSKTRLNIKEISKE